MMGDLKFYFHGIAQKIHINRAGRKAVWNRRYHLKRRISCLERDGFAVIMQDEAFFVHDTVPGRKYWSSKGRWIRVPYVGSHRKVTAYGSLALDGRQFSRTFHTGFGLPPHLDLWFAQNLPLSELN